MSLQLCDDKSDNEVVAQTLPARELLDSELLAKMRLQYQEKALEISPLDETEINTLAALFDVFKEVQVFGDDKVISRQNAWEIYDYLKISQREKDECLTKLPEYFNLEILISFRREQVKNRTYREKVKQYYVQFSEDGVNIDYDELLAVINSKDSKTEENEKIVLHIFFGGKEPPVTTRPLDSQGQKYSLIIPIETVVKNYFMDE